MTGLTDYVINLLSIKTGQSVCNCLAESKSKSMSARRIKNLLKRQVISSVKTWTKVQMKQFKREFIQDQRYLQLKSSRWGEQQIADIAKLGQKIYS